MRTLTTWTGEEVLLDDADHERLSVHGWSFDGRRVSRRTMREGKNLRVLIHREILTAPEGFDVHHVDENPLNNQRSNLEVRSKANHAEHHQTTHGRRGGYDKHAIPYKGVTSYKGRFRVQVKVDDRTLWLGDHETAEEAALVYDAAILCYRGGQGYLNLLPCVTAG